jgi:hypothetical protein
MQGPNKMSQELRQKMDISAEKKRLKLQMVVYQIGPRFYPNFCTVCSAYSPDEFA